MTHLLIKYYFSVRLMKLYIWQCVSEETTAQQLLSIADTLACDNVVIVAQVLVCLVDE